MLLQNRNASHLQPNFDVHYVFSFSMKEMGSGMGTESRLERSKGESRQENIHPEPGNLHISNNNEGESGH